MWTVGESVGASVAAPPETRPVTTVPPLARIRQKLSPQHLDDVPGAIRAGIAALGDLPGVLPGAKIAVTEAAGTSRTSRRSSAPSWRN